MRLLIIGGAGFCGSNLALYFREQGHNITVLDNLVRRGSELNLSIFRLKGIQFVHGDIRNKEDISGQYDVILECSAQPSATAGYDNPMFDFTNNTVGLMNVLEHARKTGAAVIFWSTNKVYSGDRVNAFTLEEKTMRYEWRLPHSGINEDFTIDGGEHSIYGMTKAMSDLACQEYWNAFGVKTIVNRFSCLAGPRQWGKTEQGWVSWFVIAKHLNLPIQVYGWKGKQVRDVLFIDDICSLIDLEIDALMKNPGLVAGEVFTIGGGAGNSVSILEAMEMIGVKPESFFPERKGDHCVYITDITRIKKRLGWSPEVRLKEGLAQIEEWVIENKSILARMYA